MNTDTSRTGSGGSLEQQESLRLFFVYHLNRIYAAKLHLQNALDRLQTRLGFSDLAVATRITLRLIQNQLARMEEIYFSLRLSPSSAESNELISLIDDAFADIDRQQNDTIAFDLSVLFYLQNSESLEITSFNVLKLAAIKLNDIAVSELIETSITEAEEDYKLLLKLTSAYLGN